MTKIRPEKLLLKLQVLSGSEPGAAQPHESLCEGNCPDVTVIAGIKSFDLIPIAFTQMSPERARHFDV